jgi:glycosyltransferase involved in cell wall biosynthesis
MKIAVITCYDQNDYVRAKVLRTAIAACPGVEPIIIRNSHKGLARYIEVPLKILQAKFKQKPDAYLVVFRGYEMLPFVLLIKGRKPLIFDEFINAAEYLEEHDKLNTKSRLGKLFLWWYTGLLRRCKFVLADTQAHAEYSAKLCGLPVQKFRTIPVGADEQVFNSKSNNKARSAKHPFTVFFYGNGMTPVHGLPYMLDAAVALRDDPEVVFEIIGGKHKGEAACQAAINRGARIIFERWVPFEELAVRAKKADLTLGGPFGKSLQSQFVITGKAYQFLAAGCPVVIGQNAVSGLFVDKQNCLLIRPASPKALVDTILWAKQHPAELQRIGKRGRELYEQHFSQRIVNGLMRNMVAEL